MTAAKFDSMIKRWVENTMTPRDTLRRALKINGKNWEFGPTGTPTPTPPSRSGDTEKKKNVMFISHFRLF